jgi:predicted DNA-binding protein (UPF0251 family)
MTLITQSEAARRLGISRQAVHSALCRGAMVHVDHEAGPLLIHIDEVERYRVARSLNRGGRGRRRATV